MRTIFGIDIPDLSSLDIDGLKALRASVASAAVEAGKGDVISADTLAEIKAARAFAAEAKTRIDELAAAEAEANAELDDDLAELAAAADEGEGDESDDEGDADDEGDEPEGGEDEGDEGDEPEAPTTAGLRSIRRPRAAGVAASAPDTPADDRPGALPYPVTASVSTETGRAPGDHFEDGVELSKALVEAWQSMRGGEPVKRVVGKVVANYGDDQKLSNDYVANLEKFGGVDPLAPEAQAVVAAICAPREPYYGLTAESSTRRPVWGSLPKYQAPRGGVSVYPSPRLADVTNGAGGDGNGIWTRADDANGSATKEAAAIIPCSTPDDFDIYGVYRTMTVKNLAAMTYPELVDAFRNRQEALFARLADSALLDAMADVPNIRKASVDGDATGAAINLLATLLNALAIYREEERYEDIMVDAYIPRWARDVIKIDAVRMRRTQGGFGGRIPSNAEIDSLLNDAGVNPIWTLDRASHWAAVDTQSALPGAALASLPTRLNFYFTPRGNWRGLDLGVLNIGVTNNGIYRDNTSNSKNEFTMFYEKFEGLIDFGANSMEVELYDWCPNGAQTADVTAITCADNS